MANQELLSGQALNGAVKIWLRYDDVSLEVNRLRWQNTSQTVCEVVFTRNGVERKVTIPVANSGTRALAAGTLRMMPDPEDPTVLVFDGSFGFGSV